MSPTAEPVATTPAPASRTAVSRRVLRVDQQAAVDSGARHLRKPGSRGHTVSACGMGKTLIALRTAEALNADHLLIAVLSRDLIGQWAQVARADGRTEPPMAVSSLQAEKHRQPAHPCHLVPALPVRDWPGGDREPGHGLGGAVTSCCVFPGSPGCCGTGGGAGLGCRSRAGRDARWAACRPVRGRPLDH
ncbi:DEAD/DEAH box helicase family protein [Streptomyces rectiverticillatus]|uniref:DEAD/DEAH box helicase family protein n=1 Tax=Streptomyces rectiverticillatus TaxID=173860 RepID=UPI0031B5A47B